MDFKTFLKESERTKLKVGDKIKILKKSPLLDKLVNAFFTKLHGEKGKQWDFKPGLEIIIKSNGPIYTVKSSEWPEDVKLGQSTIDKLIKNKQAEIIQA